MSNQYIDQNVDKIFSQKQEDPNLSHALSCAWVCAYFKGINLKIIHVGEKSSLADYFVMASATNSTQALAMAQELLRQAKRRSTPVLSSEGLSPKSSERGDIQWILLDFSDIIIHLFLESTREIYALDELWHSSPLIKIPEEFYFEATSSQDSSSEQKDESENYF